MTKIEEQLDFKKNNKDSDVLYLDHKLENKKLLWEQAKLAISNDVRKIIWKAWIEPLEFIKYKNFNTIPLCTLLFDIK